MSSPSPGFLSERLITNPTTPSPSCVAELWGSFDPLDIFPHGCSELFTPSVFDRALREWCCGACGKYFCGHHKLEDPSAFVVKRLQYFLVDHRNALHGEAWQSSSQFAKPMHTTLPYKEPIRLNLSFVFSWNRVMVSFSWYAKMALRIQWITDFL